jgi:hypothetical protein
MANNVQTRNVIATSSNIIHRSILDVSSVFSQLFTKQKH